MSKSHRSIKAWQLADNLAVHVYEMTTAFPREERYGLISQMRRAAVSVAANIVEGTARESRKEYLQFLFTARGSLAELGYYLHLSHRLRLLAPEQFDMLERQRDETARVLHGLIQLVTREISIIAESEPLYVP